MLYGIAKAGIGGATDADAELVPCNWSPSIPGAGQRPRSTGAFAQNRSRPARRSALSTCKLRAHAIALGAILVTNDKAFHQVPDLLGVENWATDL